MITSSTNVSICKLLCVLHSNSMSKFEFVREFLFILALVEFMEISPLRYEKLLRIDGPWAINNHTHFRPVEGINGILTSKKILF